MRCIATRSARLALRAKRSDAVLTSYISSYKEEALASMRHIRGRVEHGSGVTALILPRVAFAHAPAVLLRRIGSHDITGHPGRTRARLVRTCFAFAKSRRRAMDTVLHAVFIADRAAVP